MQHERYTNDTEAILVDVNSIQPDKESNSKLCKIKDTTRASIEPSDGESSKVDWNSETPNQTAPQTPNKSVDQTWSLHRHDQQRIVHVW